MSDVRLLNLPWSMELDTGATVSLISSKTFQQLFPGVTIQPLPLNELQFYSGDAISVLGQVK